MKKKDVCKNCGHLYFEHDSKFCRVDCFDDDGEYVDCQCPMFELYEEGLNE